jgi:TatD DNase family protein
MLIDAHCHLDHLRDPAPVLDRARSAGVVHLVVNGLWRSPGDFGCALELARSRRDLSPTVGIHPHDCSRATAQDFESCASMAADPRIVAVGETGLDFHYNHSPPEQQREAFRWTINLARRVKKPLVVHVRAADDEAMQILREERAADVGGQIHCFNGNRAAARSYLEMGFYISIAGMITFKSADELRAAARLVPLDRLLVETDSPYLAPVPHRGAENEPAYVVETARRLAFEREMDFEEIAAATRENAQRLFSLPTE